MSEPDLVTAAGAAIHVLRSILAVRNGASDELIIEVIQALEAGIRTAGDDADFFTWLQKSAPCTVKTWRDAWARETKRL